MAVYACSMLEDPLRLRVVIEGLARELFATKGVGMGITCLLAVVCSAFGYCFEPYNKPLNCRRLTQRARWQLFCLRRVRVLHFVKNVAELRLVGQMRASTSEWSACLTCPF